jgi:thioredoxin 1
MIICYIDFNQRQDLVKEFQVKTVPDTIVYRDNKEIKRKIGYKSKQEFEEWIKR